MKVHFYKFHKQKNVINISKNVLGKMNVYKVYL